MIHRINRTGDGPPVYVGTLAELRGWVARNPGEMTTFDKLSGAEVRDTLNDLTARVETLAAALNEIASWSEGPVVRCGFDCPTHATAARIALQVAGLVPVGG